MHRPPPRPQVELQLEAQDGSFVETEFGVVAAFSLLPSVNRSTPVRLVAADPLDACAPLRGALDGAVALTRRGNCSFVAKYLAVLAAGGSAMLMFNDAPGELAAAFSVRALPAAAGTLCVCVSLQLAAPADRSLQVPDSSAPLQSFS